MELVPMPTTLDAKCSLTGEGSHLLSYSQELTLLMLTLSNALLSVSLLIRILPLLPWDRSRDYRTTTGSDAGHTGSDTESSLHLHSFFWQYKEFVSVSALASSYFSNGNGACHDRHTFTMKTNKEMFDLKWQVLEFPYLLINSV